MVTKYQGRSKSKKKSQIYKSRGQSLLRKDEFLIAGKKGHFAKQKAIKKEVLEEKEKKRRKIKQQRDNYSHGETNCFICRGSIMYLCDAPGLRMARGFRSNLSCYSEKSFFFVTYHNGDFGEVKKGNKDVSQIKSIGDVHLETEMNWPLVLKDVTHVQDLRLNPVSALKLDDTDYNVNLGGGKLKLNRGPLIMVRESLYCSLYKFIVKIAGREMNMADHDSSLGL